MRINVNIVDMTIFPINCAGLNNENDSIKNSRVQNTNTSVKV